VRRGHSQTHSNGSRCENFDIPLVNHHPDRGRGTQGFDRAAFQRKFETLSGLDVVEEVGGAFLQSSDSGLRDEIMAFLEEAAKGKASVIPALLTAIRIVQSVNPVAAVSMARRMVFNWPSSYPFRDNLADCLDMTGDSHAQLEALKQRVIGLSLRLNVKRKTGELTKEMYSTLLNKHFGRMEEISAFLNGERSYPTNRMNKLPGKRGRHPPISLKQLVRLVSLVNVAGLPMRTNGTAKVTCVVDVNAMSSKIASEWFGTQGIKFIAPAEALLELTEFGRMQSIPLKLDFVEIGPVPDRMPPEIVGTLSGDMGDPPSVADKKVAALALSEEADAIVSGDRHLLKSHLPFVMEKCFGHTLSVMLPTNLPAWLSERGFAAPDSRVVLADDALGDGYVSGETASAAENHTSGEIRNGARADMGRQTDTA